MRLAVARGRAYVDPHDGWLHLPITRDEAAQIAALPAAEVEIVVRLPEVIACP